MENGQTSDKRFGSQLPPLCEVPAIRSRDDALQNLGSSRGTRYLWRQVSGVVLKQEGGLKVSASSDPPSSLPQATVPGRCQLCSCGWEIDYQDRLRQGLELGATSPRQW